MSGQQGRRERGVPGEHRELLAMYRTLRSLKAMRAEVADDPAARQALEAKIRNAQHRLRWKLAHE